MKFKVIVELLCAQNFGNAVQKNPVETASMTKELNASSFVVNTSWKRLFIFINDLANAIMTVTVTGPEMMYTVMKTSVRPLPQLKRQQSPLQSQQQQKQWNHQRLVEMKLIYLIVMENGIALKPILATELFASLDVIQVFTAAFRL